MPITHQEPGFCAAVGGHGCHVQPKRWENNRANPWRPAGRWGACIGFYLYALLPYISRHLKAHWGSLQRLGTNETENLHPRTENRMRKRIHGGRPFSRDRSGTQGIPPSQKRKGKQHCHAELQRAILSALSQPACGHKFQPRRRGDGAAPDLRGRLSAGNLGRSRTGTCSNFVRKINRRCKKRRELPKGQVDRLSPDHTRQKT